MSEHRTKTHKRLNITLPPETVRLLERVAPKGDRSRLVDQALRYYVGAKGRAKLREQLRAGALARAERDRRLAEEWFVLQAEP